MLELSLEVVDRVVTPFAGARLRLVLTNRGPEPLTSPGLTDPSGVLRVEVKAAAGGVVRRLSARSEAYLTATGPVETAPLFLETLAPGAAWTEVVDTSTWHLPLPTGEYRLQAVFAPPGATPSGPAEVRSAEVPLKVEADAAVAVRAVRDNPVIACVSLLIEHRSPGGEPRRTLRLHDAGRPLVAWSGRPVLDGVPAEQPFPSAADFFQTAAFDPAFQRFVVWTEAGAICARSHIRGEPAGEVRRGALPAGRTLLRWAAHGVDGTLRVFMADPAGVALHTLGPDGLDAGRVHSPPAKGLTLVAATHAEGDTLVVWRTPDEVLLERLDPQTGLPRDRRPVHRSAWTLERCEFGPIGRTIELTLRDPASQERELVRYDLASAKTLEVKVLLPPWKTRPPLELAWGLTDKSRFQVAWSDGAALWRQGLGKPDPERVREGPGPFFPLVIAGIRTHVGFAEPGHGFRFLEQDHHSGKLVDFEGFDAYEPR